MNLLNQCIFMGRLAADPELKKTLNGKDCCSFRLAVYRDYTDKDNKTLTLSTKKGTLLLKITVIDGKITSWKYTE